MNRYKDFNINGTIGLVPFIPIRENSSDYFIYYEIGKTRLDILSYDYYGDANYGWLIQQANPQYLPYEFMIPNGAELRIPYPLDTVLIQYQEDLKQYKKING